MSRRTAGVVLCSVAVLALAAVRVAEALHDDSGSTVEDSYFAIFVAGFLLLVGFFDCLGRTERDFATDPLEPARPNLP